MKHWWARTRDGVGKDYGRWVPTGQVDLDEAKWYMKTLYPNLFIKEWLQL